MSRPTVQLFVHPRRRFPVQRRIGALCAAFEALGAGVIITESLSDRLAIAPLASHVCAVGGDGTLRHVVDAVRRAGRPIPISVYPAGTVNLIAMECDYPRDPAAFAQRVLAGEEQRDHHIALLGDIPLLACASVGPDSHAVAGLSARGKDAIGRFAYALAFCKVLIRWRRPKIMVLHDGQRTACEAVYIAKGRFFAGRWSFAPDASVGTPLLHVAVLREASRTRFLLFVWALLRHRPVGRLAGVESFTCTELTLLGDATAPLQGDGDIIAHLPVSIALAADAICFS